MKIKRTLWAAILICMLAITARLITGPRTIDDSFITFRYARNILAGNGFVYNPGERVLGTTTPLYTILLTLLGASSGGTEAPFPILALGINALADGLTCCVLIAFGKRLDSPLAGLGAALAWSIAPFSVTFASGGLETSLYVLLLLSACYAHLTGKHLRAALFGGLALLTRPDALILLGPLALDRGLVLWQEMRGRRKGQAGINQNGSADPHSSLIATAKEASVFLAVTFPWFLFAAIYFGSPIPHSITAKSLAYQLPAEAAFVRLLQHYATPFLGHLTFGASWIGVGLVLYPFLFLVGALRGLRINRRSWPFLAYPWLYFAVFSIANPLIFRWYLTPPLPMYMLTILIGLEGLIETALKKKPALPDRNPEIRLTGGVASAAFILFAPFLLTARGWTLHPDHGLASPAPEMAFYEIELLYRQAAEMINLDARQESGSDRAGGITLAAGDVGVLGFYTGVAILDTVGLNSPEATPYYPLDPALYTTNYAVPPELILDKQPGYVVILEIYGRNGLLKSPQFQERYELLDKIPTDIYGSRGLLLFKHRQ